MAVTPQEEPVPVRFDTVDEWVGKVLSGANNFAADMREKGIHVGLGSPPQCVICGVWPCDGEPSDASSTGQEP